jgi:hypothetical protein
MGITQSPFVTLLIMEAMTFFPRDTMAKISSRSKKRAEAMMEAGSDLFFVKINLIYVNGQLNIWCKYIKNEYFTAVFRVTFINGGFELHTLYVHGFTFVLRCSGFEIFI